MKLYDRPGLLGAIIGLLAIAGVLYAVNYL